MPQKVDVRAIIASHQAAQAKATSGAGGNYFKPPNGTFIIRVLLFVHEDVEHLSVEFSSHFLGKGIGSPKCLEDVEKGTCPVCGFAKQLQDSGDKQSAQRIWRRSRYAINILHDGEIKMWEMSPTAFATLTAWFSNPEWGNIADPKSNYEVRVTKTGSGKDTDYAFQPAKNPTPLPKGVIYGADLYEKITYQDAIETQTLLDDKFDVSGLSDAPVSAEPQQEAAEETNSNWADETFGPLDSVAEEAAKPTSRPTPKQAPRPTPVKSAPRPTAKPAAKSAPKPVRR